MIKLSVSKDITKDFQFQEIEESFEAVAKILLYNNWSCSNFKDGHRNKQNFVEAQHIALDFDNGLTLLQAKERFKDYWHIISTTRNHQKPKNSITCDRFRVILKLEDLVTDAATFEETYLELLKWNPESDTQTKDCSRFFYRSNTIEVCNFEGSKIKIYKPKAQVISIQKSFREPSSDDGRRARAYIKKMGPAIQGNNGQAHLFKVCMSLYNDFKLQDEDALAILKEWNQDNIPPWKEAELESIYQSRKRYANKEKEGRLLKEEPAVVKIEINQNDSNLDQRLENETNRLKRTIRLFHQDSGLDLPKNSVLYAVAKSGQGKTTFVRQSIVFALKSELRVLFVQNEQKWITMIHTLLNILIEGGMNEMQAKLLLRNNLRIIDRHLSKDGVTQADAVCEIITQQSEEFKPDIIFLDQLNKVVSWKGEAPKGDLKELTRRAMLHVGQHLGKHINDEEVLLPPIVITQQSRAFDNIFEANELNWIGCTQNAIDTTHILYIRRIPNSQVTEMYLEKDREGTCDNKKRYSKWEWNEQLKILVPTFDDLLKKPTSSWKA